MTRELTGRMKSVLRCIPAHGSGESISPHEVAGRLGLAQAAVNQLFVRARRKNLVVRLRPGAYQLAAEASP